MRGTRAKALRTSERPNPGRKGGGATKDAVRASAFGRWGRNRMIKRYGKMVEDKPLTALERVMEARGRRNGMSRNG